MKNIGTINATLPDHDGHIEYLSDTSLRDYDIIVFDPEFPYLSRIEFSGGGSCVDIEGASRLVKAMDHWRSEFRDALSAGKTIFVLLNSSTDDSIATGYTTPRKGHQSYNTRALNNYSVFPSGIGLRNATGRRFKPASAEYRDLHNVLKEIATYKVIITTALSKMSFLTNDGGPVGGVIRVDGVPGHLVLLPHFDLTSMIERGESRTIWTAQAVEISKRVIGQLVAIDKTLRSGFVQTPLPSWIESMKTPAEVAKIDRAIEETEAEIGRLEDVKQGRIREKRNFLKYRALLFENGRILEAAVEDSLRLLGYEVENFRREDVEIDHVIVGPSGLRMIGESEGKDNSAVDIAKFRQLETNINEDFAREDVSKPAKGILFGNGYRLAEPSKRESDFTTKCLVNAKRLGTALVRTRDLYDMVIHVLDHPDDDAFREKCRVAIESTPGEIVVFPTSS